MSNTKEQYYVVLPLPSPILSPNCQIASMKGRFMKAAAAKKFRRLTAEAIEEQEICCIPWDNVLVEAVFSHKLDRRRDADNAMGMLKPAYDGIVDAGIVSDDDPDHMTRSEPVFKMDKKYPHVMLILTKLKRGETKDE